MLVRRRVENTLLPCTPERATGRQRPRGSRNTVRRLVAEAHRRGVEERFSKTLRRKIGPVDCWGGPGKVEPDRRPAGEVGEVHQSGRRLPRRISPRSYQSSESGTRKPLTISDRASSICCCAFSPGRSRTRNGSVLLEMN